MPHPLGTRRSHFEESNSALESPSRRENMKTVRMSFGWLFGFFSICSLVPATECFRRWWVARSSAFWVLGVMVSLVIVYAMAWWTTWKGRPAARAWGISASLANLSISLYMLHGAHRRFAEVSWEMLAVSAFSLVAYSWPDREKDSLTVMHSIPEERRASRTHSGAPSYAQLHRAEDGTPRAAYCPLAVPCDPSHLLRLACCRSRNSMQPLIRSTACFIA
jgi:hypothetical protein